MHIVDFNKRSKASAMKESETGQNYFTDTQKIHDFKTACISGKSVKLSNLNCVSVLTLLYLKRIILG